MNIFIIIILLYLAGLTVMNFWKSRKVKTQDDMMLAGRSIGMTKMVFTLICTWIGSGTFIAGAEFAAKAGWSALWQAAGVGVGIIIIYFLAAKIRTFGQYTVGDILEVRYGPVARIFGAIAIIISFTTIVSYQFKAGGYILKTITEGAISNEQGMFMAFLFVTVFTMVGGMVAIANTDLPNGIIILTAMIVSTPLVIIGSGGFAKMNAVLPVEHMQYFNSQFTYNPPLKIMAIALSSLLLLLGVQSLYQKFYSARSPQEAKKAAGIWVIGTIIIESVAVVMAIFASVYFWADLQSGKLDHAEVIIKAAKVIIPPMAGPLTGAVGILLLGAATVVVISTGMNYLLSPTTTLIKDIWQRFFKKEEEKSTSESTANVSLPVIFSAAGLVVSFLIPWFSAPGKSYLAFQFSRFVTDQPSLQLSGSGVVAVLIYLIPVMAIGIIIQACLKKSTRMTSYITGIIPFLVIIFLLVQSNEILGLIGIGVYLTMVAAMSVIIFGSRKASSTTASMVFIQKFLIILVGVTAYFLATRMESVLENALFAYTIYGVAVTPALLAALAWKRVTKTAGLISIISATVITVFLKVAGTIWPAIMRPLGDPNADPFGIPILYPALAVSLLSLVIFSYITKPPSKDVLSKLFPEEKPN